MIYAPVTSLCDMIYAKHLSQPGSFCEYFVNLQAISTCLGIHLCRIRLRLLASVLVKRKTADWHQPKNIYEHLGRRLQAVAKYVISVLRKVSWYNITDRRLWK